VLKKGEICKGIGHKNIFKNTKLYQLCEFPEKRFVVEAGLGFAGHGRHRPDALQRKSAFRRLAGKHQAVSAWGNNVINNIF
jgi:hypothetical protein